MTKIFKKLYKNAKSCSENARGSEHTVDGKAFSAELHLVHYNTKYGDLGNAVDKPDGLAVLGMFIKIGNEHPEFGKLCEILQDIPRKGDTLPLKEAINPANFLPSSKSYWTYLGSLTTPPLYESVTWILFKQPVEISRSANQFHISSIPETDSPFF